MGELDGVRGKGEKGKGGTPIKFDHVHTNKPTALGLRQLLLGNAVVIVCSICLVI